MDSLWGAGGRVQRCTRERPSRLQLTSARQMLMDIGVEHRCSIWRDIYKYDFRF
jgi:hypothetical protein